MTETVDDRLRRLRTELDGHARIARHLGLDFERPVRSLGDGYPENTIALIGKISERLLKQLWTHHEVLGDPSGKALNDLIKGCRPHIRSTNVLNALTDIQRLRNRSTHDGYDIAEEDGLLAVRRLLDVLEWFTSTGVTAITGEAPALNPLVERKAEFLAGLYTTLGYRLIKRFELSESTVYQLFCRQAGLQVDYVEIIIGRNVGELDQLLAATGGELLQTRLPKLTRFLIVDDEPPAEAAPCPDGQVRIVAYDRFVERIVDVPAHLAALAHSSPTPGAGAEVTVAADVLETDPRTGDLTVTETDDAAAILRRLVGSSANVLVIGGPGSGKTTLLHRLAIDGADPSTHRYRFYLDLSLKGHDEQFADFVTRVLGPHVKVPRNRVFDVFLYLIRAGSVLCVLDAIDEAVANTSLPAFLDLFADVAQAISAESTVVLSSRYSFLADSPQVRRLLNSSTLISEKLVQQLHAGGVDPLELPRFSVVRLDDVEIHRDTRAYTASPLELLLAEQTGHDDGLADEQTGRLAALVAARVDQVLTDSGLPQVGPKLDACLGAAFLADRSVFTLAELCTELGIDCFTDGRVTADTFLLAPLFRQAGPAAVAPVHTVFQEYFAARHLRAPAGRAAAAQLGEPFLTEQVRRFLHHLGTETPTGVPPLVLPAGTYLLGPSHRLLLRTLDRPVLFDEHPVTVGRYKRFLAAVERDGCATFDHSDTPAEHTHSPWAERLRNPAYFTDPAYDDHPVTCVNWWSAHAFARFEGKRLPTCVEWEAAARGTDGRLFPWGDALDLTAVNCADSYSGHPLVTYEVWKQEIDSGQLRDSAPTSVMAPPTNRSPFGVRGMAGNVWEWTATLFEDINSAVICGGSYDNPYRAVQTSSKGLYRRRGASNAVGFRCVQDLP
ncbi:SUMF1/EgtB/PvdO family nonheme iron enzyme [Frankia sp. CNm7]|uniref:SUMF1/EgtB/PvdO family nonheme iron enzyme n=1 Tax=Frankia nepalensis TaxID=1836974 RepID=A0A937UJX3_9ACTN|nr:SUMF1/EgtB/PvdO family nonheme iron enzyme [Frankia nepalensis]MBL7498745.1 SUMF1/EgtB/PvdO family nonheme iron enzyme [Frankia nepalensis]MBL7508390.1 SUMF1/EgtB/PvdO family nonheme iron enzyme [Frankia nepalensis]MBL7517390.1 SUMF1/EgtB/PvdO family nonheme iron enzyme [Frankia nepalensis]MBL7626219.1 SUMF1/EgtB/PvdO family nonheme iron enzyme [Frankia nepalensis]